MLDKDAHETAAHDRRTGERRADLLQLLARLEDKIDALIEGFPGGDLDGHRRYHEAVIQRMKSRTEFWQKLLFELTKLGLISFAVWAFLSLWQTFLRGPK